MATFLYKLGRLAFRRRWLVALAWVMILGVAGFGAASASSSTSDSFSLPDTEAQQAFDLLEERMPEMSADGATARVVFQAPDGDVTDKADRAVVEEVLRELGADSRNIAAVVDPYRARAVSQDRSIAFAQVSYTVPAGEMTDGDKETLEHAAEIGHDAGLTVEIGGEALDETAGANAAEIIGVALAAVVLVITFGAFVAAGLTLATALIGVAISIAVIMALSSPLELGSTTPILAMMLGLAVGIDYALFIVFRYRTERLEGREREEAVGRALGTAGSAVVFAGLTVLIALSGMAVVGVPLLTKMGLAAAGAVALAVIVALTLVPAALGFAGDRVLPRKARKTRAAAGPHTGDAGPDAGQAEGKPAVGTRWARFVLRRPVAVLLAGVVGLGAMALPVASLELGLGDDGTKPTSSTQRRAYDLLSEGFGPGFNGPLLVTVDLKGNADAQGGVAAVVDTVSALDDVAAVGEPVLNTAGDTALINVTPESSPGSTETKDLVTDIRAETGDHVLVTGQTAMNIDFSQKLTDALVPYLAVVVGLAFVLLMVVFRSLLVPLKAALGFLLSVLAALGAVVAVFQWGWAADLFGVEETGPIMSMMPIFLVGVVFGLAMDYEVFLVSRMREAYVHGETPGEAVVTGFRYGARVVTAAAVIMISVFAGFVADPEPVVQMIGFGLATAVLLDAFVVRMAIVPAVLALLGRAAWWLPRLLDRILPNVDIEGEGLNKKLDHPQPEVAQEHEVAPDTPAVPAAEPRVPSWAVAPRPGGAGLEPVAASVGSSVAVTGGVPVRGRVRDTEQVAVAGAAVTLISLAGQQLDHAITQSYGSYYVDAPGPGSYVLIVSAAGYQPHASTIVVGDEPVTYEILLSGTSGLAGAVRAADSGAPVAGAVVVVTDVRGDVLATGQTDTLGEFALRELVPGTVTLAVNSAKHRPLALPVEIGGTGVTRVEIVLEHGAHVRGTVRGAGAALNEARVTLMDAAGNVVATATTGTDGAYAFADLDSGEYTVVATGYPPKASAVTVSRDGVDDHDIDLVHSDE